MRHRVPLIHIVRMVVNVLLDLAIGELPVVGDIFDIAFEENLMNMRLLMRYRDRSRPPRSFAGIAIAAVVIVGIIAAFAVAGIAVLVAAAVWIANQR